MDALSNQSKRKRKQDIEHNPSSLKASFCTRNTTKSHPLFLLVFDHSRIVRSKRTFPRGGNSRKREEVRQGHYSATRFYSILNKDFVINRFGHNTKHNICDNTANKMKRATILYPILYFWLFLLSSNIFNFQCCHAQQDIEDEDEKVHPMSTGEDPRIFVKNKIADNQVGYFLLTSLSSSFSVSSVYHIIYIHICIYSRNILFLYLP